MGLFTDVEETATVTYVTSVSGSIIDSHDTDVEETVNIIYEVVEEDLATVSGVFRENVEYILDLIDNLDTNLSAVQVRRTTDLSLTTSSGVDVVFDTIDLENNEEALDYDDVGNQKITVGEPGLFFITYNGRCTTSGTDCNIYARVVKNGSEVLIGSDTTVRVSSGKIVNETSDFIVILSLDDYITFQIHSDSNDSSVLADIVFTITHMRGKQGPPGEDGIDGLPGADGIDGADGINGIDGEDGLPGAGSAINILEDNVLTASGVGNLNFEGGTVSLTDDGNGYATVTVSGIEQHNHNDIYYTKEEIDTISGTLSNESGTEWQAPVVYEASDEEVSSTSSTSYQQKTRLTVDDVVAGKYRIGWSFEWAYSSSSSEFILRVQLNDTKDLANCTTRAVPANSSKFTCSSGFCYETLLQGTNYIDVDWCSSQNKKTSSIRKVRLDMWRVL